MKQCAKMVKGNKKYPFKKKKFETKFKNEKL